MSTKAGPKNYTVYVTDISGAAKVGVITGWQVTGRVNTDLITTGIFEEIGNGFYFATIDAPMGSGFIKISNTDSSLIITPSYFVVDDNTKDTDDIYALQDITNTNVNTIKSIVSNMRFESQQAAGCFCLGPPGASQPPFNTERLIATVYPKIFDYSL